jgi:hypothetical protein
MVERFEPDTKSELPSPARAELLSRAAALVERHPECFSFWHPEARVSSLEDVRLVVRGLRKRGDRRAWLEAQELHKSLSELLGGES